MLVIGYKTLDLGGTTTLSPWPLRPWRTGEDRYSPSHGDVCLYVQAREERGLIEARWAVCHSPCEGEIQAITSVVPLAHYPMDSEGSPPFTDALEGFETYIEAMGLAPPSL